MPYIGKQPANVPVTADDIPANSIDASKIIDGAITIADIADDAVTADKLANSINSAIAANTAKVTNSTSASDLSSGTLPSARLGTVTGFTSTGIDDNATSTAITIDSSENVGFGTPTPAAKFHIKGTSASRNTLQNQITIDGGTSVGNPYTAYGFGIDYVGRDYGNATRNYAYVSSVMATSGSSGGGGDAGFSSALVFGTNSGGASGTLPTEKLRLTADGRGLSQFTAKAWIRFW